MHDPFEASRTVRTMRTVAVFLLMGLSSSFFSPPEALAQLAREAPLLPSLSPCTWPQAELQKYWELNGTYGDSACATGAGGSMIVSTSGALAVHTGLKTLDMGGSAADAAIATALAQITLVAGSWSSFAGMLYALYYEAGSGQVYALNAGFNTILDDTAPFSIPRAPTPSGRTAMVGGFMAGVGELHRRFGRIPFDVLVQPAICLAEQGVPIDSFMEKIIAAKEGVLTRTPEGRSIFTKADGALYQEGDTLRQPQLAATLRKVAEEGSRYMYTGRWAENFVAALRAEGGRISSADLKAYETKWEKPLATRYGGYEVSTVGYPELGAVQLIEALNVLELAGFNGREHYSQSSEDLFRLIEICRLAYVITYSSAYRPDPSDESPIPWISPRSRTRKETARRLWELLRQDDWEQKLYNDLNARAGHSPEGGPRKEGPGSGGSAADSSGDGGGGGHSDAIVVIDRDGNVAVVVHSINTSLWGSTGIFVDGVSIPDPASFQQAMVAKAGPGRRFPNVVNPVIVTLAGRPVLAAGAIGNALHECMLEHLVNVLDYGMDPCASLETPKFWGPMWGGSPQEYEAQAVDSGAFRRDVLSAVRRMGRPLRELREEERKKRASYWAGIRIDPDSGRLSGAVSDDFNGIVEAHEH